MRAPTLSSSLTVAAVFLACAPAAQGPAAQSAAAPASAATSPGSAAALEGTGVAADGPEAILERRDLEVYHGWIKYLAFRAAHADERFGKDSEQARQDHAELASWTQRILQNPRLLAERRGVFEWAYVSPVDGSGQPFKINVPTDYEAQKRAPLSLYMHGYSGNHLEHSLFMKERTQSFEVSVLGRSRGGRYRALSEADVLHVLDYVSAHWAIDPDRVHLTGGSMGGGGTFWLGSRYPHRFASGRPVCGFGSDVPIGNLLTFPLYATHSDDDFVVPVLHARGPIARLKSLGGDATLDETTGLGHASWDYTEGNQRADVWHQGQARPASSDVKKLTFTALDGNATRAYWAEIREWGESPAPASFALEVTGKNRVVARATNVTRLALRLGEAPLDAAAPLEIVLGESKLVQPAPLPSELTLVQQNGRWAIETTPPSLPQRLHTPGGANQLYAGESLLIVYGTSGTAEAKTAMRSAAVAASHGSSAAWPSPNGDLGDDGVSHNQNLYGELKVKADVEVDAAELASHHLVLIGTAEQNALVARMASELPVRYESEHVRFSDGSQSPSADSAIGLVHYNPLAPSRLVFWVASNEPAAYDADALVPQLLGSTPTGADFVQTRVADRTVLMARSFDSRWSWQSRDGSPALPVSAGGRPALSRLLAETARRATGADYAFALETGDQGPAFAAGSVRLADLTALLYHEPIAVMTITGAELAAARLALASKPEAHLQPEPSPQLDPKRSYRVAITARQISPIVAATHLAPKRYELTDRELATALARMGF